MESYFNLLIDFRGHNPCLKTPGTAVIYAEASASQRRQRSLQQFQGQLNYSGQTHV